MKNAATCLLLCLAALPARAEVPADMARLEVLPGWQTESGTRMAALRVTLADGWHTYWRAPGEAGIPPSFDWSGSQNLAGVTVHWPVPRVYDQNGQRYIGYEDVLVLPLELTPRDPAAPINANAKIEMGVCEDICVPVTARFSVALAGPGQIDARISDALADRPRRVSGVICDAEPIRDGLRITASLETPTMGAGEIAVLELSDRTIWITEPIVVREGAVIRTTSEMVPPDARPFMLDRSDLRMTVIGALGAVEALGCSPR